MAGHIQSPATVSLSMGARQTGVANRVAGWNCGYSSKISASSQHIAASRLSTRYGLGWFHALTVTRLSGLGGAA